MKTIYKILSFFALAVLGTACDNTINYDEYGEAPIIEDVVFTATVDHINKSVSIEAMATGNDYYEIIWGDGTPVETSDSGNTSHTYSGAGNYKITVTARKDGLVNEKAEKTVSVALISNLVITSDVSVDNPGEVTLNTVAINATSYEINWGDGSPVETTTNSSSTHTYPGNGDYQVDVTAKADGFVDLSGKAQITIVGGLILALNKTFEDGDVSDWDQGYPGALSVVEDPTNPNNQVLFYDSNVAGGWNPNKVPFNEINGSNATPDGRTITLEYNFYPTVDIGWSDYYRLSINGTGGSAGRVSAQLRSTLNTYRVKSDGGEEGNMIVPTINTWHSMKIIVNPTESNITYILDGDVDNALVLAKGSAETLQGYTHFDFGCNGNNDMYLDNIRVGYEAATTTTIKTAINKDFETGDVSDWVGAATSALSIVDDPVVAGNKVLLYDATLSPSAFGAVGIQFDNETPTGTEINVNFRIYTPGPVGAIASDYYRITQRSLAGAGDPNRVKMQINGGENTYRCNTETGDIQDISNIAYNTWHSVSIVIDPISNTAIYTIDGDPSNTVTIIAGMDELLQNYNHFEMGARDNNSYIDDIKVTYEN